MSSKAEKPQRQMSRHQESKWQREHKRNFVIRLIGIILVVGVIASVGIGWIITSYRPLHETVITVNDTKFNMQYLVNTIKAYNTIYAKLYANYGQTWNTSNLYSLVGNIPAYIERNELVRQAAAKLGYTVSDDEINKELKDQILSSDARDIITGQLLSTKLQNEYFGPKIPATAEQRNIMAMFVETKKQAEDIITRLDQGEDFTTIAGELSLDSDTKSNKGDLGWHTKEIFNDRLGTTAVADYAFGTAQDILSPPLRDNDKAKSVGYWLIDVLERNSDTAMNHVQAILLGSLEEAQSVKQRLDNGEDFATIAKEVSQDSNSKEAGGDLGQLTAKTMSDAFDAYAFNANTELNKVSDPIQDTSVSTKGGYWLVKVTGIEADKQISDDDMSYLKSKAESEWATELFLDENNIVDHSALTTEKLLFAVEKAIKDLP